MRALQNNAFSGAEKTGRSGYTGSTYGERVYRERLNRNRVNRERSYAQRKGDRLVFAARAKKLLFMLMLFFFATPGFVSNLAGTFGILDKVLMAGELVSCLVILMIWLQRRQVSPVLFLVTALYGLILVSTVVNGGNVYQTFRVNMDYIFLVMLVDNEREDIECFWEACCAYLAIMIAINLVTMVIFPEGMFKSYVTFKGQTFEGNQANWFFANQNGLGKYLLCLLFFKGTLDYKRYQKLTPAFWVYAVLCIASPAICQSATSLVCVGAMILIVLCADQIAKYRFALFNIYLFILVITAFFILFIVVQNVGPFAYFITEVLHKSLTFSGRTKIWTAVIRKIFASPLIGYGYMSREAFKEFMNIRAASDAHNYFLTLGIYGGFTAIVLMLSIVLLLAGRIRRVQYTKAGILATTLMFTFFMMMLFENTTSKIYWCVFASIYYLPALFGTRAEQERGTE